MMWDGYMFEELKHFGLLLVFGNIENLILAAQGVGAHVDPVGLAMLSLCAVLFWLLLGTFGTRIAMKYSRYINFIGGLAIFILGLQAMFGSLPEMITFFN